MLVARDKATLRELEEYYSLEDALNIYEIIVVTDFNEEQALKAAQKKK